MTPGFFLNAAAILFFGFFATLSAQEEQEGGVFTPTVPPPVQQPTGVELPGVDVADLDATVKEMILQVMSTQVAEAVIPPSPVATRVPTPNEVKATQPLQKEFHELETGETPGTEFTPQPRDPLQTTEEEEVIPM